MHSKFRNDGFTLIELLVVMAIIGVLTAVAVPQYRQYRARAFDTRALNDLRNVAIAEEAYFLDHESYLSCQNTSCQQLPGIAAVSRGVALSISAGSDEFQGTASHKDGSGRVYRWDSSRGGLLDEGVAAG